VLEEFKGLKENSPSLPEEWELALELGTDGETGEVIYLYYFMYHPTRCLSRLHYFDTDPIIAELCGVTEKTRIRKSATAPTTAHKTNCVNGHRAASSVFVGCHRIPEVTSLLTTPRSHGEMFPHKREIPEPLMQELTGMRPSGVCW